MGTLEELGELERKIILKKWEGLGISNDFLFGKVMQNAEEYEGRGRGKGCTA